MRKDKLETGLRGEIIRRVIALPRIIGDSEPGAVTTEQSLKSNLIAANTVRQSEAFVINCHGSYICNNNTVTLRIKFGGTTLVTFTFTVNESAQYYIVGDIGRQGTNQVLEWGFVFTKENGAAAITTRVFTGQTNVNFTVDNTFEITGQKSVAGDTLIVDSFIVAKHPLL